MTEYGCPPLPSHSSQADMSEGLVSVTEALQLFTDAATSYLLLLFLFLPNDPHIRPNTHFSLTFIKSNPTLHAFWCGS